MRLLLETLNDPYPTPRSALVPDSGPAPSRYVPCETCRQRGQVRARGGWVLCLICDGTGQKIREGEPEWDAYLEMPLLEAIQLPRASRAKSLPGGDILEQTYAWERARRSFDRHGSYAAVRRQLESLATTAPSRYRLVDRVLVRQEPRELTPAAELELELGVVTVALRIGRVRVPPWLIERSEADGRRTTIDALTDAGLTPGQIARRLGLSRKAVQRKMRRAAIESAQRRSLVPST